MARKKEKVYEYVELTDRTPVQKLSLSDQVRVLIKRLTYDSSQELKREDAYTLEEMKLRADLFEFVVQATEQIRRGVHKTVDIEVSSKFEPVFDSVFNSSRIRDHYRVTVNRPVMEYDIHYFIKVRMEVIS